MATPLVETPPLEQVRARAHRYKAERRRRHALVSACMVGLLVTGVTFVGLDRTSHSVRMVGEPRTDPGSTPSPSTTIPDMTVDGSMDESTDSWFHEYDFRTLYPAEDRPRCPVDTGKIQQTKAFQVLYNRSSAPDATLALARVERLVRAFNERGGVCGRLVELVDTRLDDPNPLPLDTVAVLGMPLDPKLDDAISSGRFEEERIAVVGGDGLAMDHHRSNRVYPMGTSAAALAKTAVQHSAANGARRFAIVYDKTTQFGREAAAAFSAQVVAVGGTTRASVGIDPTVEHVLPSRQFKEACDNAACDVVFLALLPGTAATWLQFDPPAPRMETTGLPTLLTDSFSGPCVRTSNRRCNGLTSWSGFVPRFDEDTSQRDIDTIDQLMAVSLHGTSDGPDLDSAGQPTKDTMGERRAKHGLYAPELEQPGATGALVEATVAGAHVLLKALLEAGPTATRSVVWETLEAESFTSRLPVSLRWGPDGLRTGNPVSQAWRLSIDSIGAHNVAGRSECTTASTHTECLADTRVWRPVGTGWLQEPR